jgi:hypothetical protein
VSTDKRLDQSTVNDYRLELEQAADDLEQASIEELLTERLVMLGGNIGDAERAAAQADKPRERSDGQIIGLADHKPRPLTKAQYQFAQSIIEGKTKRQAYKDAYPNTQANNQTISAAAHKLAKDSRIQKLINTAWDETEEALSDDLVATKRYVMKSLLALSKTGKQEGSRLKALELLGRHAGMWQAQQVQQEKTLTAEELRKELAVHLRLVSGKRGG